MTAKMFLIGFLALGAMPSSANEALHLRVSPAMAVEPAWITVQASIEPDASNRALYVVIDSEEYFRSSQMSLEGDKASRTNVIRYRNVPAGRYEVTVVLVGRDGRERATQRQSITVVP